MQQMARFSAIVILLETLIAPLFVSSLIASTSLPAVIDLHFLKINLATLPEITIWLALLATLSVLKELASYHSSNLTQSFESKLLADLRLRSFSQAMLSPNGIKSPGSFMQYYNHEFAFFAENFVNTFGLMSAAILTALYTLILLWQSPAFTLFSIVLLTSGFYLGTLLNGKIILRSKEELDCQESASQFFLDSLFAKWDLKNLGKIHLRRNQMSSKEFSRHEKHLKLLKTHNLVNPFVTASYTLLILGGIMYFLHSSKTTNGEFLGYAAGITYIFLKLKNQFLVIVQNLSDLARAQTNATHVEALCPLDQGEQPGKLTSDKTSFQSLELIDLAFAYPQVGTVIENLSLKILCEQHTLIYGPSGSGKSTLGKIIAGALEPTSGKLIWNQDSSFQASPGTFVAAIAQSPHLLNGSIRENVCLGSPVSDDEIKDALEATHLWGLVSSLGFGLDTLLGERQMQLSRGQLMRLMLCRALIVKPQLLILDETLAALEEELEQEILLKLKKLPMTLVYISHRKSIRDLFSLHINLGQP